LGWLCSSKPAQPNSLQDSISKILNTRQGWQSGSSSRGPAPNTEFLIQTPVLQKKKKKKALTKLIPEAIIINIFF
jgi:hypothetical protein